MIHTKSKVDLKILKLGFTNVSCLGNKENNQKIDNYLLY